MDETKNKSIKRFKKLVGFIDSKDKYPSRCGDKEEKAWYKYLDNITQAIKGKNGYVFHKEFYDIVEKHKNPLVNYMFNKKKIRALNIEKRIEKVTMWTMDNLRLPSQKGESVEEKRIAQEIRTLRKFMIDKDKDFVRIWRKVSQGKSLLFKSIFDMEVRKSMYARNHIAPVIKFIKENSRYPSTCSTDKKEYDIAKVYQEIRQTKKGKGERVFHKTFQDVIDEEGENCELIKNFFVDKFSIKYASLNYVKAEQKMQKLIDWIIENDRYPKGRAKCAVERKMNGLRDRVIQAKKGLKGIYYPIYDEMINSSKHPKVRNLLKKRKQKQRERK